MNIPYGFHAQPGATIQSSDTDPDVSAANECRDVGNIHYCAGASLSLGYVGESPTNNTGIGLLFVTRRGGGGRSYRRSDAQGDARPGHRAAGHGRPDRRACRKSGVGRAGACEGSR